MRYNLGNLKDFEFHDSVFSFVSFEDDCLTVECEYLNIHKDSACNPFSTDMEIEKAEICFKNLRVISYEKERSCRIDENGNHYTDRPRIVICYEAALEKFTAQLKNKLTVLDFDIKENDVYFIDGISIDPFFTVCFMFENITVSWDDFKGEAWYTER